MDAIDEFLAEHLMEWKRVADVSLDWVWETGTVPSFRAAFSPTRSFADCVAVEQKWLDVGYRLHLHRNRHCYYATAEDDDAEWEGRGDTLTIAAMHAIARACGMQS